MLLDALDMGSSRTMDKFATALAPHVLAVHIHQIPNRFLVPISMYAKMELDGTFSVVPKPFKQCLIVMAFEPTVNLYVPI
ncbi:hypothetical protein F442_03281 [Phytophthora nicotianae P10297]|uniref:Uncharacterized protein n=1 Tax=Phytophthora nicotianae P10297 TaxID=1317064 RepID=W2ZXB3_PHYNI|nr:hypothetical protein F442_03281 [Phytophthora nicotianae P10297]